MKNKGNMLRKKLFIEKCVSHGPTNQNFLLPERLVNKEKHIKISVVSPTENNRKIIEAIAAFKRKFPRNIKINSKTKYT